MKLKTILLLNLLFVVLGCAPKVYVDTLKPAQYDVSDIQRIAVLDFGGNEEAGKIISGLFIDKLWKTRYFTMVERQEIEKVLGEHAFNMSGAVDDSTIVEFGKILGVDAIIVGNVNAYSSSDTRGREKVKEKVFTGKYEKDKNGNFVYEKNIFGKKEKKKIYEEQLVDREYILREATVSVSYRMVEIGNATIRASDQTTKSFRKKYTDNFSSIPPKDDILGKLSEQSVDQFVPGLAPHHVSLQKTMDKGNDAVNLGINYAKHGLWDEAIATWEAEIATSPGNAPAHYNLGLAYEAKGNMEKAEEHYRTAMKLKPKDLYLKAVSQISDRKTEQQMLKKQLRVPRNTPPGKNQ